jgi:hypothetical protein
MYESACEKVMVRDGGGGGCVGRCTSGRARKKVESTKVAAVSRSGRGHSVMTTVVMMIK